MYLNECLTDPSFKQGSRDIHHQQCAPTCFIECSSEEYAIGTFPLSYVFNLENRYVRIVVEPKNEQLISLPKHSYKALPKVEPDLTTGWSTEGRVEVGVIGTNAEWALEEALDGAYLALRRQYTGSARESAGESTDGI